MRKKPKEFISSEAVKLWAKDKEIDYSRTTILYKGQRSTLLMVCTSDNKYYVKVISVITREYDYLYLGIDLNMAVHTYNETLGGLVCYEYSFL